jgi:2-amino-4-hydroxy-6-hydroxymethyldihydropteridine diphosphokinase
MVNSQSSATIAFIAIGSNLDNPIHQVTTAINTLAKHQEIEIIKQSSLYITKPYGYLNQDDFINAVIKIKTSLNPHQLFQLLQNIETQQNRKKIIQWGPRTIDLDILVYGNLEMQTADLTIPHHDLENRHFVIMPWHEIDSDWVLPNNKTICDVLEQLKSANKLNDIRLLNLNHPYFSE